MRQCRPAVLGIDLGTTSAKVALFDSRGAPMVAFRTRLSLRFLSDGGVEQDPEEIREAFADLIGKALSWTGGRIPILAAGIACQRSTVLIWERTTGRAVGPAVSWMDRRGAPLAKGLSKSSALIARRTGLRLSPHYGAIHLARLFRSDPVLRRLAGRGSLVAGPVASFVISRALNRAAPTCDPTLAQRTLLFDVQQGRWSSDLCELFGVPPALLPGIQPSVAEWGHIPRASGPPIPVLALAGDQQAAAAAFSLDTDPSTALVQYGTGAFVLWPATPKRQGRADGLLRSLRADRHGASCYAEGTVNTAGAALDTVSHWLGRARLNAALASDIDPATLGECPVLVPAFAGLGAPHWDDEARPVLFGPGASSSPVDIARAALLGIAHRVADILEAGAATLPARAALTVSGPLAHVRQLVVLQAEVSGREVRVAEQAEATLLGIARIAARAAGAAPLPPIALGRPILPRLSAPERRDLRRVWKLALRASRTR